MKFTLLIFFAAFMLVLVFSVYGAPQITVVSPTNNTYDTSWLDAIVTLNETGSWCGRSLDGGANVTMTNSSGNWNNLLTDLSLGTHTIRFYCNNTLSPVGNMSSSDLIVFGRESNFTFYNLRGFALNYLSGSTTTSGNVTVYVKETGRRNTSIIRDGNWIANVSTTANYNANRLTFGLLFNDTDNKNGYSEFTIGSGPYVSQAATCSYRPWTFTGYIIDFATGTTQNSGTISVSIEDAPFSNTTSNSTSLTNGYFSLFIYPCLISGETYTFHLSTFSAGSITSNMFLRTVAK